MAKIKTLSEISTICKDLKKQGKSVGLITGCFDILHIGHVQLFRSAKGKVDVVMVGLENDKSIQLSKGKNRPINTLKLRMEFLSELISVDYVFPINKTIDFSQEISKPYRKLTEKIMPDYLITDPVADKYWSEKKNRAKKLGIKYLAIKRKKTRSSSSIIEKLNKE